MPDEGVTAYDDLVFGRIEVANESLEDVVILRSDGRPTYNFASPVEDLEDGITHVIRGTDHVSNTPKQIRILEALGAKPPTYAHVPFVNGPDGRKLSKRHGAITVDEFRQQGYLPEALVNFLALLGWSYDDRTEIMSRSELVERFSLDRVGRSPAIFDYVKLADMNGKYLRALDPAAYADALVAYLREQGYDWDEDLVRRTAPLVQDKISRFGEYPGFAGFFFDRPGDLDRESLNPRVLRPARDTLASVDPFEAESIQEALRAMADALGLKPREAFQPIRVAVTGSTVSPGLFESLEVLGKDESLARLS
jgi:glutamyl-tRNA synthetase